MNSFKTRLPVDRFGNPLPWVTYSYIYFISDRLDDSMDVFEFGLGNSTLWYANKVNKVTSIEHDKKWYEKFKQMVPSNVTIHYEKLATNGQYSKYGGSTMKKYDIIVVDGRDRVNCLKRAVDAIKEIGVIILDDSHRKEYLDGVNFLLDCGYRKIDFWGITPGFMSHNCTTIFYKEENCLNI